MRNISNIVCALAILAAVATASAALYIMTNQFEYKLTLHRATMYTVKSGDTVWRVAEKFFPHQHNVQDVREYVHAIKLANGWKYVPVIDIGDKILIPLQWKGGYQ